MSSRPPPLQWLPAFEAAARLSSFSRAAAELHVTTSAISQQIRQLEAHLGRPLFVRAVRAVSLTPFGRDYADWATEVVTAYRAGHARLIATTTSDPLCITMTPLVAHELVLPSLADFQAQHPDVPLRIESTMALVEVDGVRVHGAIRYGDGAWPGLECLPLSRCKGMLVTSQELAARHPVSRPQDLAAHTLIHQRPDQRDWAEAAHRLGIGHVPRRGDLVLDSNLAAWRAAEQGLGVAIAVWPLVQPWLDEGRLTCLLPAVALETGDHFVFPLGSARREALLHVHAWLRKCFRRLGATHDPDAMAT